MDAIEQKFRILIPVCIDLICFLLYFGILPWLTHQFQRKSFTNLLMVTGIYCLFCAAVLTLRVTAAHRDLTTGSMDGFTCLTGILFALMMVYIILDVSGCLDIITSGSNPGSPAARTDQSLTPGTFAGVVFAFLVLIAYPLVLTIKPPLQFASRSVGSILPESLSLLVINLMIITTMAHWDVTFKSDSPYTGLSLAGKILIFSVVYLFFLLFYASPRMIFHRSNPSNASMISFVLQTGYYVWHSLNRNAWQ